MTLLQLKSLYNIEVDENIIVSGE